MADIQGCWVTGSIQPLTDIHRRLMDFSTWPTPGKRHHLPGEAHVVCCPRRGFPSGAVQLQIQPAGIGGSNDPHHTRAAAPLKA
jgi:hypothetical protein